MEYSKWDGCSQVFEMVMGQNSELVKCDIVPQMKSPIKAGYWKSFNARTTYVFTLKALDQGI